MSMHSIQLCVVATQKRKAIVLEYLGQIPHKVCWTTDYKLEPEWKPEPGYASLVQNQVGAMRCYRGHQDALKWFRDQTPQADICLVLEDDAVPNRKDWVATVSAVAFHAMEEFELVSLHGRAWHQDAFTPKPVPNSNVTLQVPKEQGKCWVQGSLAYLIRRDAVDKFIDSPYVGYPSDLFICNRYKFALIDPTPFNHDRSAGSLIDCATPQD